jgi:acyl-CoA synthetase (AMP-forming)/AMP-acid ligase II
METALTPLEFARRARKLYGGLDAVIDEDSTYTYTQFFERCDRWSAALQQFGVRPGDRVAYIVPNTRAQLESFYAVPQIGAVLVPINYRLTADDFAYLINHGGARVVCVDCDYMDAVDRIRPQLRDVEQFIALNADREGWLNYESLLQAFSCRFSPVGSARKRSAHDQLHKRHIRQTQRRDDHAPQRLHERNWDLDPRSNEHGRSVPLDPADVSCQWVDVRLDRDRRGCRPHLLAEGSPGNDR